MPTRKISGLGLAAMPPEQKVGRSNRPGRTTTLLESIQTVIQSPGKRQIPPQLPPQNKSIFTEFCPR